MRKRGKYEAVPQKASAPSRRRKHRGLLQIYVTSLTTLLMCLSMFLGTTMAWFTDTVSSGGNLIQTGVLKVDVLYNGQSLRDSTAAQVFGGIEWTPGMVQVRTLTIRNEGTLPILYRLGLQKESGSTAVASEFNVYYKAVTSPSAITATSEALASDSEWKRAGNLSDIFNGTAIVTGNLSEGQVVYYAVAIQMRGSASADNQGKSIQMAIKLNAYQQDIPDDYIGTEDVSTVEGLESALPNGKKVAMTTDLTISRNLIMNGGSLDGSGHTLEATHVTNSNCAITTTGGTISNLTVIGSGKDGKTRAIGSGSSSSESYQLTSDLTLREVNIDNVQYAINGSGTGTARIFVTDSSIYGWISYANIAHFSFENCNLGKGNSYLGYQVIYGDTTYDHCNFNNFYLGSRNTVAEGTEVRFVSCQYTKEDGTTVNVTKDNFIDLFLMDGDEKDFALLNVCEIYVDGVKVDLSKFVADLNNSQTTSEETPVETTAPAAPAETTTVPETTVAASEAASEPVTE